MTPIDRLVSKPQLLLPSPERDYTLVEETQTEPSPEQFIEEVVVAAALNYTTRLNDKNRLRGGQAVLKLTTEDQKIAVGVILDAIRLAQTPKSPKAKPFFPAKPRDLRRTIKTGLELREKERLTAKQLVDGLKQVATTGGKKSGFYDLGLNEGLVRAAGQELSNYSVTPQPVNARKLMAMVPARRQAVKQMSVTAAAAYMAENQGDLSEAMSVDEFIALNLGFVGELLDTEGKQAPVDRGAIVATASGKKGKGVNPTFLEPSDLKPMTVAFSNPKIVREIPGLAAQVAGKLLAHSPELIPTGTAAMKTFGGQIRQAVILAEKAKFSRENDEIAYLTARAEIFGILPIRPMLGSEALILRVDYLSTAKPDTHHLWGDAIKMTAGPGKMVLIPTPEKLVAAKALLSSIQTSDDSLNGDRERLLQAIKAWRSHKTAKITLPGKIKKLEGRIKELGKLSKWKSPLPAEVQDLHPIQLETAILAQSGQISALTRRINSDNAILSTHRQLSIVSESTAPDQFAIRFLQFRQMQAGRRREAVERKKDPNFGPEPTYSLTDFPRHPFEIKTDAAPETPAEELARIRGYLAELNADKAKPLPSEFLADRQALWHFLRLWQKRLPLDKHGKHRFDRVTTGINILSSAKDDDIGRTFWRPWFIDEVKKRENALVTQSEQAQRYHDDKAELDLIRDALSSKDPNLITKTAGQLAEGQHSVPFNHWIKMQSVPLDFLKKLKGAGKNDQSPESIQLKQAQELVKLFRSAQGRVQMRIPHPDRVDKALDDKLRAAQNYKASKIATIATINQLMFARKNHNPLVPLDIAERATLGELITATNLRIEVARAAQELNGLLADRELAKQRIAELKEFRTLKERTVSIDQLKFQRDARMRELKTADSRLVETMEALHLAADPEMIPKRPKNK